ncbi:MEDS domain-containing protein [Alicyclobacillus fastidiosus]|uniref:MEDS domain-containing protein n=1 Tax=Alicyclobacillus fastidiosus TaxID=392011 RepID=A0ABY6ZGU4_9BACL|nr:MEDS domain-containing protein [Alicyclobacillus fastidiosus]WAH42120.1 MEDS domain-containing protein [Alicyclobacillus fastidiosus]GMA63898.1 hypothetical protein GCM10025859_43380 [Alicyclobacillus fastidiosus]
MYETIPLTKSIRVGSGSHILYVYTDDEVYTDNVASYVEMGFDMGQHVVYIDSEERYMAVCRRLTERGREQLLQHVSYVNNYDFYMMYGDFHFERRSRTPAARRSTVCRLRSEHSSLGTRRLAWTSGYRAAVTIIRVQLRHDGRRFRGCHRLCLQRKDGSGVRDVRNDVQSPAAHDG